MANAGLMKVVVLWITAVLVISFCVAVEGGIRNASPKSLSGVEMTHGISSHQPDNDSEVLQNDPKRLLRSFGAVINEWNEDDIQETVDSKLHGE
jgi:hypothetical protein